jgi:hypothetical protein
LRLAAVLNEAFGQVQHEEPHAANYLVESQSWHAQTEVSKIEVHPWTETQT